MNWFKKRFEYYYLVEKTGQIWDRRSINVAGTYWQKEVIRAENYEAAVHKVRVKLGPQALFRVMRG